MSWENDGFVAEEYGVTDYGNSVQTPVVPLADQSAEIQALRAEVASLKESVGDPTNPSDILSFEERARVKAAHDDVARRQAHLDAMEDPKTLDGLTEAAHKGKDEFFEYMRGLGYNGGSNF